MPASCAAINCTNRFSKEAGRSFYRFPLSNNDLCQKWIQAMRRHNWMPTKSSFLCSDHFEEKCFRYNNERRSLQPNAVPTIFKFPLWKEGTDLPVIPNQDESKVESHLGQSLKTITEMELEKCKDTDVGNISKDLIDHVGICCVCGSTNKVLCEDADSKLVCVDCNTNAVDSVILTSHSGKGEEYCSLEAVDDEQIDQHQEKWGKEGVSEEAVTCEDVGEYELTVTEDALLRLHGLSLSLPIPCDLCPPGTVFDDLDEFDAHMSDHPEAKMFACQLCSNTYKSWSNLVAHRKVFHQGEVLSCVECGSRRSHARLEGAVHFPVGGKPHGCEECDVGLDTVSDVYRHYWRHMAPPGGGKLEVAVTKLGRPMKRIQGGGEETTNSSLIVEVPAADENNVPSSDDHQGNTTSNSEVITKQQLLSKNQKHTCPHCYFSCGTLEEYRSHLLSNTKAHGCSTCGKSPLKRVTFTDHEYCHPRPRQYNCIPCSFTLDSEESFDSHVRSEHQGERNLPCCLCGRKYDWLLFVEHLKLCQRKRVEWETRKRLEKKTCQPCGKVFRRIGALRRHVKLHDANRKRQHDCISCGRSFQHGGAYAKHLSANPSHGPTDMQAKEPGCSANFMCEYCGRTFAKRDGLKIHLMRHRGVKPFACPNCPKAFLSRTSLSVHIRQHTGERPYMCEICGKNFTGPTSLYVHQRTHRLRSGQQEENKSTGTKHTCPVCGKILSSKLVFEGHVRQHTGERPFTCDICGKGFTTIKIMKMHVKRHELKEASKVWVEENSNGGDEETDGFENSSTSACIFLCPKCGVGLLSPEELEEHMAGGDCPGGGSEMFVLPMNSDIECIDTGSVVELLANPSATEVVNT